jgi:hypothetical protein
LLTGAQQQQQTQHPLFLLIELPIIYQGEKEWRSVSTVEYRKGKDGTRGYSREPL